MGHHPNPMRGFRASWEILQQIDASCAAQGIAFAEWVRQACVMRLANEAAGDPGLAYAAARSLVMPMVKAIVARSTEIALQDIPDTFEEAMARYGVQMVGPVDGSGNPYG